MVTHAKKKTAHRVLDCVNNYMERLLLLKIIPPPPGYYAWRMEVVHDWSGRPNTANCTGISVGIGFSALAVHPRDVLLAPPKWCSWPDVQCTARERENSSRLYASTVSGAKGAAAGDVPCIVGGCVPAIVGKDPENQKITLVINGIA